MKTLRRKPKDMKPCPFCGGAGEIEIVEDDKGRIFWTIGCETRGCIMWVDAGLMGELVEKASIHYEQWNNRK